MGALKRSTADTSGAPDIWMRDSTVRDHITIPLHNKKSTNYSITWRKTCRCFYDECLSSKCLCFGKSSYEQIMAKSQPLMQENSTNYWTSKLVNKQQTVLSTAKKTGFHFPVSIPKKSFKDWSSRKAGSLIPWRTSHHVWTDGNETRPHSVSQTEQTVSPSPSILPHVDSQHYISWAVRGGWGPMDNPLDHTH